MGSDRKQKLIDLGSETLAEALLDLAVHSDEADDLIEQLIAKPKENVQRFTQKLSGLKSSRRFVDWRGAASFSRELEMLLQDLKSGVDDPLTGVELVAAFYEADSNIFEMCDDSSGNIGDVFRYDAKKLFVEYASRCKNKEKDEYGKRHHLMLIESLARLHDVIQIVMGWTDSHLHEFTIGNKRYTEYPESKEDGLVCGRYHLGDLIKQKGRTFRYLYDFRDSWEHELVLEESRYFNPELRTELACFEGERACPPEDVGGVPGYFEFCNALKDPSHEEHESYMEWSGDDFDSERFDSDSVNWDLMKYLRWSRDRYQNRGGVE